MKNNIVVIGSSNTDMIVKAPKLPGPGETVLGGSFSTAAGGKGANQAVAAARAGGAVDFVACVGEDTFGEQAVRGFAEDGINTEYIFTIKGAASGVALIVVDGEGENSIAVAAGANAQLCPDHLKRVEHVIAGADILAMQLEVPLEAVQAAAEIAAAHGVKVILDPAPAQPLEDDVLEHVSILTPNESEVERLTGIKATGQVELDRAASVLLSGGVEAVLITLGASGVYVATEDLRRHVPGFGVEAIDTTAAGDVFNGTLAVALAQEQPLLEAVRFANAAAALSVTAMGAQPSAPHCAAIVSLLSEGREACEKVRADGEAASTRSS